MNALQKIKLSTEINSIVAQLKGDDTAVMERVRLSRRLNVAVVELGGTQIDLSAEGAEKFHTELKQKLGQDELSDNTNDENYRWKDTAMIAGARKHMAALFTQARKDGRNVMINEIDWNEMSEDNRLAQTLITKQNLFGTVDWNALREKGMPSEVAYLIKRIYTAVDKAPLVPTNVESQKNYVRGVASLREKLEACRSYDEIKDAVVEISRYLVPVRHMIAYYENPEYLSGYQKLGSLETRAYTELGKRFFSWIFKTGNSALTECRRGRVPSTGKPSRGATWEWLDGEPKLTDNEGKPKAPKKTKFQLQVADHIERIGGTPVDLQSSKQLEEMFGLRGVQSGNWVLKDKASAEFHMKGTAESMLDMGDIIGIPPQELGLQGNLALAFGARGKGGACAHYEPASRVINMTKMRGGGFFGHEYFHAIDNLIRDFAEGEVGSVDFYGTKEPSKFKDPDLARVFGRLQKVLNHREGVMAYQSAYIDLNEPELSVPRRDDLTRKAENFAQQIGMGSLAVLHAAPLDEISEQVEKFYQAKQRESRLNIRGLVERQYGEYLVLRYYDVKDVQREGNGLIVEMKGATSQSKFYKDSMNLDDGKVGKYWSADHEMAARAFSAYLEDKLTAQGRKNTYLTFNTIDDQGRGTLAHPDGKEREAINAAFDDLFKVIREKEILKRAAENKALMDSIFNSNEIVFNDVTEGDVVNEEAPIELLDEPLDDTDYVEDPEDAGEPEATGEISIEELEALAAEQAPEGKLIADSSNDPDLTQNAVKMVFAMLVSHGWEKAQTEGNTAHFEHKDEEICIKFDMNALYTFKIQIMNGDDEVASQTFNGVDLDAVLTWIDEHTRTEANHLMTDSFEARLAAMEKRKDPDSILGLAAAAIKGDPAPQEMNDILAQTAATGKLAEGEEPTQNQLIDNDYRTGSIDIAGIKISIENPVGSVRRGVDPDGTPWETTMTAHYGFINDTIGADGDELDVFVAEGTPQDYIGRVFVIDQIDKNGRFDEHKVILGVTSKVIAADLYRKHYDENFNGIGSISEMSIEDFKAHIYGKTALYDSMESQLLDSWAEDGVYEMLPMRKLDLSQLNPNMVEAKATVKDPIVVFMTGNKYYVIHGAKRLEIAKKNSDIMVPAILYSSADGYTKDDLKKAIRLSGSIVHAEALGALIHKVAEKRLMAEL